METGESCNPTAVREGLQILAPGAHEAGGAALHRVEAAEFGGRVTHPNGAGVLHGRSDVRLVQDSNGLFAEYVSSTANDAEGTPTFFVDVCDVQGPGEIALKG